MGATLTAAIIGAGLIGKKRAAALASAGNGQFFRLKWVADQDATRAESLAALHSGASGTGELSRVLSDHEVDLVIIATLHDSLAGLTRQTLEAGKHVLVEKPGARSADELEGLLSLQATMGKRVRVGYNHRFHPGLRLAGVHVARGDLGPMLFVRARYGHGGRVGYEKEWRADARLSGGGELIDQGVHLIDLARWYLGDFTRVHGLVKTLFWKMEVDDNAFLELETADGQVAWLHASCSEWKNLFSMEIYGRDAKILVEGLGGSYGPEKLTFYQMKPEMGPPITTVREFPAIDDSWKLELEEFYRDITEGREPNPGLHDALAVLKVVQSVYRENRVGFLPST